MNHNILNKIIEKSIKEHEKTIYAYLMFHTDNGIHDHGLRPSIIKANSREELYVKIFDKEIENLLFEFLMENSEDPIIEKYIDPHAKIDAKIDRDMLLDIYYYTMPNNNITIYTEWKNSIIKDKVYIDKKIYEFIDNIVDHSSYGIGLNISKMNN